MKNAWHCTDLQTAAGAVGPPTGRDVDAENPPTVTARSTIGAGVFFGRGLREGARRNIHKSSRRHNMIVKRWSVNLLTVGLTLLSIIAALVLGNESAHASPGARYVVPGGDCGGMSPCYSTVQGAVDAAQPGDEIRVASGTYTGINNKGGLAQVVYIDKSLIIRGGYTATNWNDPDPDANLTELNATALGRVMVVTGTVNVTVEGLRLTYGNAAGLGGHPTTSGSADAGGGVYVHRSNVTLSRVNVMTSTVSDGMGGGIYQYDGALAVEASTIQGNYGKKGGGAYFYDSTVNLTDNTIQGNNADDVIGIGGGIDANGGNVTIRRNTIRNNSARQGGGIGTEPFNELYLVVAGNTITNNSEGGVYLAYVTAAVLSGNTVSQNTGDSGVAVIYGDVTLVANTVTSNTIGLQNGAGISVQGDAKLIGNLIQANQNTGFGGAGVYATGCGDATTFRGNVIRDNISDHFYSTAGGEGGGLYLSYCDEMLLTGNLIAGNKAYNASSAQVAHGGGVYLYRSDVIMENNLIVDNLSEGAGSGMYVEGSSPSLYHTTIANNIGGEGSGISAVEEELFSDPSVVKLYNSIIVSQTVGVRVDPGSAQNISTLDGVLWYGNGSNTTGTAFVFNETTGIPGFVDPAGTDYHITANSAAIDKGIDAGVPGDCDGEPRFGTPDLGADEYWAPGVLKRIYLPLAVRSDQ
jgi:parallel beta-helix repeat protein